ncbi:50S ribosomal protein L10 [bacterium]|nr:50S ribosomal protein L10 [bacterium]
MEKAKKIQEVDSLVEAFNSSIVALCADYRGLTVEQITNLRSGLKEQGAFGKVVKNTLAKISVDKAHAEGDADEVQKFASLFQGPSLVVFSKDDPVAPAKVLAKFAKEHEELEIKGGFFEGKFLDVDGVKNLSSMPSRDELYSKLLNVISAPATKVVQLLQAPGTQFARLLGAYQAKLEDEG